MGADTVRPDVALAMTAGDETILFERKMRGAFALALFGAAFGGETHGEKVVGCKI